jgi:hypothetical protein
MCCVIDAYIYLFSFVIPFLTISTDISEIKDILNTLDFTKDTYIQDN